MIRQRKAEIHGFNENVSEDEAVAEISQVSGEEIAAEIGGETSNEHAESEHTHEETSHGPAENGPAGSEHDTHEAEQSM